MEALVVGLDIMEEAPTIMMGEITEAGEALEGDQDTMVEEEAEVEVSADVIIITITIMDLQDLDLVDPALVDQGKETKQNLDNETDFNHKLYIFPTDSSDDLISTLNAIE